jgi:hypothetical protein
MLLLTCSEPAYLWPYTAYKKMMMGEIVARNMWSKVIAENKNTIVATRWTYFTIIKHDARNHKY